MAESKTITTDSILTDATAEKASTTETVTAKKIYDPSYTVKFLVGYAADHKGNKPMMPGTIQHVAPDVAEVFTQKGFGKIVS